MYVAHLGGNIHNSLINRVQYTHLALKTNKLQYSETIIQTKYIAITWKH